MRCEAPTAEGREHLQASVCFGSKAAVTMLGARMGEADVRSDNGHPSSLLHFIPWKWHPNLTERLFIHLRNVGTF